MVQLGQELFSRNDTDILEEHRQDSSVHGDLRRYVLLTHSVGAAVKLTDFSHCVYR